MASFKTRQQQTFEDLEITKDELKTIGDALKKEEFRKLLHDYVDEVTDPENQKIFEKEITQLEKERGNDVTFIHPSPGYVIKTSVEGKNKAFINISCNENIGKPTSIPDNGGMHWSIPYSQAPPREDLDKKKNVCFVFDVVFHPDTLRMVHENHKFKELVSDTAMNAVESNFNVTLDKKNLRYPKISYKGFKHPTVIRRKSKTSSVTSDESDQGIFEIPNYPYSAVNEENSSPKQVNLQLKKVDEYTTPKYILKQRRNIDIQECTNSMTSKINAAIPNELILEIELPLIKSASNVTLDVTEKSLKLVSEKPAKYKLDITLPYTVDEDKGNAKFDSRIKKLIVTLLVKHRKHAPILFETGREDSGVDSDIGSGFRSTESSSSEDENLKPQKEKSESLGKDEHSKIEVDDSYRTKKSVGEFLESDKHYSFPQFSCNVLDNVFAFTFHVRNVEPDSVKSIYMDSNSGFHLKFTSIGSGFFPIHYSFCFKLINQVYIDNENFNVEVWDNNVIAQITVIGCDNDITIDEYLTGVNVDSLEKCAFPNPVKLIKNIQSETDTIIHQTNKSSVKVVKFEEDNVVFEISNSESSAAEKEIIEEEEDENEQVFEAIGVESKSDVKENKENEIGLVDSGVSWDDSTKPEISKTDETKKDLKENYKKLKNSLKNSPPIVKSGRVLSRTLSECQTEKTDKPPCRGILKVCRSLSESSVDDYHWSSSVDNSDPNSNNEKVKKTVRFSDSISKKTFRSNSSILGQRKKNQRKSRNKKRAQERRASESENSENEIDENRSNMERDLKSDEETSETQSDVSESDDGLKVEKEDVMSLSKRNPHKRGGKKSARKCANTAKMAFSNNLMFDLDL